MLWSLYSLLKDSLLSTVWEDICGDVGGWGDHEKGEELEEEGGWRSWIYNGRTVDRSKVFPRYINISSPLA